MFNVERSMFNVHIPLSDTSTILELCEGTPKNMHLT
ncbi:Unannotated [Lentimonas sp. CC4]|nr:Unannotated [Lentimonas sp. CC4]CAA6684706.1 Unannotated [Lentimonas sp. CC6]CAA7075342.1 Unannotated [Lentimonas sp. CC4]CAA7170970.1 Unannotated [Lentimonas sp. CC21]CAA7182250.1 Unannotated [Lentimonas sp. CC8]